ncbi:hypothetical protein, partial [Nocardioides sp.]|uniref:hypothetical protein n=1 Tax=Nocardioides sp. TaxID=35761 RepID=UPI0027360802
AAGAVAAVVAETGRRAPAVLRHRAAARVLVTGPASAATRLTALLAPEGVAVHTAVPDACDAADVVVVLAQGEADREVLDRMARRDVPHLLVAVVDGHVRVGPFVVPGRTACLRCVDAHHLDRDPRHPVLIAQYTRLTGRLRSDGVPDAIPSTRWEIALATAADDVLRFLDERTPTTWSATLSLEGDKGPVRTPWPRHPRCGCSWGEGLAVG